MDYLNYLPQTPYDELPEAIRQSISAEDYALSQQLAQSLVDVSSESLPPGLQAAFQQATTGQALRQPRHSPIAFWLKAAAVAGLFFAASTLALLLREPETKTVYELISAPVPEPRIVKDTIYQDRVETLFVYRTRYDTVTSTVIQPAQLVVLRDTLYLPTNLASPVKSKTAASELRLLDLLIETE